ncbi:hypothetical protein QFC19_001921 [Naganishia cerealis]|uniref:Uncharacterized protein n=1 Tax=Naganishia cerealis TaxID=610337 RepID=A0ACC2WFS7_9TREE|nr:hypothetical protein QFC19_001921 [Naganishia cerealis]
MSASSPAVFSWTLKKCRSILDLSPSIGGGMTPTKKFTATPGSFSASGRKSMSSPQRAPTTPTKTTPTALRFDPLNLPGSSAKKVATALVGRKTTRDLSDLRRKTSSASTAPVQETQDPSRKEPRASSADVPIVQVRPSMATKAPSIARNIADPVVTSSAASVPQTPSKQRAHPSSAPQHAATPSQTLVPPSPSRLQLTPRRQTKTVNSPSRLARTPTGQASPMHNALMKTKLESASATRMTASVKGKARALPSTSIKGAMGESLAFEGEDAEDDDLPSPSKRRRVGTTATPSAVEAAASARKGVDLAQVILDDSTSASAFPSMDVDVSATDFGTLNRPTVSARKINRLFQPLPSLPVDPYASIPAPPLVFTGPFIFYESEDRGSRVFRKMVPPDDMVWGDPYALVNSRRQTEGKSSSHNALLSILKIQPDQVAEANKKMERTKKRRLKRMKRLESGFKTEDPPEPQSTIPENTTCTWDREFGIPVDTNEESVTASLNVPDWQERLDLVRDI